MKLRSIDVAVNSNTGPDSSLSNPQADSRPRGAAKRDQARYPIGHFDIYVGEAWERAVADQTEFLVRTLKP